MKTLLTMLAVTAVCLAAVKAEDNKTAPKAEVCPVSGEKLGAHGKPYVFTHEGKEVKLCCKACLKDFKQDPDKYLKKPVK